MRQPTGMLTMLVALLCQAMAAFAEDTPGSSLEQVVQTKLTRYNEVSVRYKGGAATSQNVLQAQADLLQARLNLALAKGDSATAKTTRAAQCINARRNYNVVVKLHEAGVAMSSDVYQAEIALRRLEIAYYADIELEKELQASRKAALVASEKELASAKSLHAAGMEPAISIATLEQEIADWKRQLENK